MCPRCAPHRSPAQRDHVILAHVPACRRDQYLPRTTVVKLPQVQFPVKLPMQISVVTKANRERSSLASIWMQVEVKKESNMICLPLPAQGHYRL